MEHIVRADDMEHNGNILPRRAKKNKKTLNLKLSTRTHIIYSVYEVKINIVYGGIKTINLK